MALNTKKIKSNQLKYVLKEKFKDVKGVMRIRISKNRQRNALKKKKRKKDKQRLTKLTHKTKDRVTRTPLKSGGELRCSGRVRCS